MKIKEIKCPNCNANIKIKENATKGVCEYCKGEFVIDDGTINIEHTGTIEITDDTSLKIAETTLNKFKDYDKSLILYQRLIYKYAHKKEVYIGLIRSITKDFQIENISLYQLNCINDYWQKYISLASNKEIAKYETLIKEINQKYWYNALIDITNNFNANIYNGKVSTIETYYHNYLNYCDTKENVVNFKYQEYLSAYKKFIHERHRKRNSLLKIIGTIFILVLLIIVLFLLMENTNKKTSSINLSEINEHYYQIENDYQYFTKYFKETISNLKVTGIKLNNEDKSVDITVSLKNILITKNKVFNFKVIDDMGPVITPKACSFTDTETVNVYECFSIYDFTDGIIDNQEAQINQEGLNFKTEGTKTINVRAKDKDGNENSLDVDIIITKTPIALEFNVEDKLIVGNTYNSSYKITPNTIADTSVSYTYDQNLLTITNGKIKVLKKGQTEICAVSNYNQEVKQCKTINLELQCKSSYTFTFDGSKEETITAGENFCTGTYKIYASVMNKDKFYHLKIRPKDAFSGETLTIYKTSSFLNEEGRQYALTDGYTITTEIGITSVKLVK